MKLLVGSGIALPQRSLLRIQRIVCHHDGGNPREFKHFVYVRFQLLAAEELSCFRKVLGSSVQTKGIHYGDDTACSLRNRRVLLEQRTPDQIGLFSL